MNRIFSKKRGNKVAAILAAIAVLGVCPDLPEQGMSRAAAATVVHDRPHQRGGGEFYRTTDSGHRTFSDKYGAETGETVSDEEDKDVAPVTEPVPTETAAAAPVESRPVEPEKQPEIIPEEPEQTEQTEQIKKPEKAKAEKKKKREKKEKIKSEPAESADVSEMPKSMTDSVLPQPLAVPATPQKVSAVAKPVEMKPWRMKTHDIGGTLLLSDNPECIEKPGIYYSDQLKGDARVLYYHVNETKKALKTLVILENKGEAHTIVHVTRVGTSKPSPDYLAVGKETQLAYFGKQTANSFILAPGERRVLLREMERQIVKPQDLVYGCIDFTVTNPVIATILVCEAGDNPFTYMDKAPIVKADEPNLRGSYTGMNRLMTGAEEYRPSRDGAVYFYIGENDNDKFRSGIDATDGKIMTNNGNYGIVYNITIPCRRGGFRVYLAPRGGVYAGAVHVETDDNYGNPKMVETPTYSGWDFGVSGLPDTSFTDKKGVCLLTPEDEVAPIGFFEPKKELRLELSPPGASNLPIRIILVPDGLEPLASDAKRG